MSVTDINIYCIGSTALNEEGLAAWLLDLGAPRFLDQNILEDGHSDIVKLNGCAAKRCYNSFEPGMNPNVTRVREDWDAYFDHVMKVGHGSVLAHGKYTYAIEGLSRVCTAEMNRHHAGVDVSEASMRFIRMKAEDSSFPYWLPNSLRWTDEELKRYNYLGQLDEPLSEEDQAFWEMMDKKVRTAYYFEEAFTYSKQIYDTLVEIWNEEFEDGSMQVKKEMTSMLRRIIPIGVATGAVYSFNIRALRHVLTMRCAEDAEEEICYVCTTILKDIMQREPTFFGDFYQDDRGFWRPKYVKV